MNPKFEYKEEKKLKERFHPSDCGQLGINLILQFKGEPETNPTKWNDTLRMEAGKGVETAMCGILKDNGVIQKDYTQDKESFKIEREGVPVSMRFDAIGVRSMVYGKDIDLPNDIAYAVEDGEPVEIKSINNKNSFDIKDYIDKKPRENYVMQLAMYMDALGKDRGHLFCSTIDGLHTFWFVCEKQTDGTYKCGNTIVDIQKEYKRWAKIWADKDKPYEELTEYWNEELYKIPVEQVDWLKLSTTKISDARNGRWVAGSENKWKVDYSRFKALILKWQGVEAGYSEDELSQVKALTEGYTTKKKAIKSE